MNRPFRLMLVTDDVGRSAGQLRVIIEAAIAGGVTAVQVREKRASANQLQTLVRKLLPVCKAAQVPLILNGSLLGRLSAPLGIDGIHFNAGSLAAGFGKVDPSALKEGALSESWPDMRRAAAVGLSAKPGVPITGYSAHSFEEARLAISHGADYVTLSPVFETQSKPGQPPSGTGLIAATRTLLPQSRIIGLGGINEFNADEVIRAGADGIAVINAIMSSTDPQASSRRLRNVVESSLAGRDLAE